MLDCHSCVHCTVRNQAHPCKRRGITCTQRRRPGPGFAIFRRIAPTCFFVCNVLVIVMERHLTLTLTSDHINNARNEFLRSDLCTKMVLRINLILLLKKLWFAIYWGGHVGFWRITRAPQNVQPGSPVEVHTRSAVYGASQIMSSRHHHRKPHIQGRKVIFDLDFDLGSHK